MIIVTGSALHGAERGITSGSLGARLTRLLARGAELASRATIQIVSTIAIRGLGNAFDRTSLVSGHVIAARGAGSVAVVRDISYGTGDTLNTLALASPFYPLLFVRAFGLVVIALRVARLTLG